MTNNPKSNCEYGGKPNCKCFYCVISLIEPIEVLEKDYIRQEKEASYKEGYEKGLHEMMIKIDKNFAEGIAKGTDEASKMVREMITNKARENLLQEIEEEVGNLKTKLRDLNEDNPQYVLGWNSARYVSAMELLKFIESKRSKEEGTEGCA